MVMMIILISGISLMYYPRDNLGGPRYIVMCLGENRKGFPTQRATLEEKVGCDGWVIITRVAFFSSTMQLSGLYLAREPSCLLMKVHVVFHPLRLSLPNCLIGFYELHCG